MYLQREVVFTVEGGLRTRQGRRVESAGKRWWVYLSSAAYVAQVRFREGGGKVEVSRKRV